MLCVCVYAHMCESCVADVPLVMLQLENTRFPLWEVICMSIRACISRDVLTLLRQVYNEPEGCHGLTPATYVQQYDAITSAIRAQADPGHRIKFVGYRHSL